VSASAVAGQLELPFGDLGGVHGHQWVEVRGWGDGGFCHKGFPAEGGHYGASVVRWRCSCGDERETIRCTGCGEGVQL
jgi:hypothetical protein